MSTDESELSLLVRVGEQVCALPIAHVGETMRPLPVRPFPGAPGFVRGLSIVRGEPIPVVDALALLGGRPASSEPTRFVTLRVGERRVALAVDAVLGIRPLDRSTLAALPPLLGSASELVVSAIGLLDADLLLVLRSASLMPESFWATAGAGP